MPEPDIDAIVLELRAARADYPHGLRAENADFYVEHEQVGAISHEDGWLTSADVRLAHLIVLCVRHMPAILDAVTKMQAVVRAACEETLAEDAANGFSPGAAEWVDAIIVVKNSNDKRLAAVRNFLAGSDPDPLASEVERREGK